MRGAVELGVKRWLRTVFKRKSMLSAVMTSIMLSAVLANVPFAMASPANPALQKLYQPDGSSFDGRIKGDEWINWKETQKGYPVAKNRKTGFWEYAVLIKGRGLVRTGKVVGRDIPRGIQRITAKGIGKTGLPRINRHLMRPFSGGPSASPMISGTRNLLVILVGFSDRALTTNESQWNTKLFGAGDSVKNYFSEVSYNQLTLNSANESYGTANNGIVQVTLGSAHPNPGVVIGSSNQQLAKDAITAADPFVDFGAYDFDLNGKITTNELHVMVIPAGYEAANTASTPSVWAHKWSISSLPPTLDGVKVGEYPGGYTQAGELHASGNPASIGILAHELGHDMGTATVYMGLPDLYDTDDSSRGIGKWDLMGTGNWNGFLQAGDKPAHLSAWSKWYLGWLTPKQLTSTATGVSLPKVVTAADTDHGVNQVLFNPGGTEVGGSGEYFLLENRQQTGFDSALPSNGLLIWHIDETRTGNSNEGRKLVDLEEADGLNQLDLKTSYGDAGDPYPGSIINRTFNAEANPNSLYYDGSDPEIAITNISNSGATMSLDITFPGAPPPPPEEEPAKLIEISSPTSSAFRRGWITIVGSATGTGEIPAFSKYVVERQQLQSDSGVLNQAPVWSAILNSALPVKNATLARFNSALINGRHRFRVTVFDKGGNITSAYTDVELDNKLPLLGLLNLSGAINNTQAASVRLTATDIYSGLNIGESMIWVNSLPLPGSRIEQAGSTLSFTPQLGDSFFDLSDGEGFAEGLYSIAWQIKDQAGNNGIKTGFFEVKSSSPPPADKTKPVIGAVTPVNTSITGHLSPTVTVAGFSDSGTGLDLTSMYLSVNGKSIPAASRSYDVTANKMTYLSFASDWRQGENQVYFRIADNAGNKISKQWSFTRDNLAPAVEASGPLTGSYIRGTYHLRGSVEDPNLSKITLESWEPAASSWKVRTSGVMPVSEGTLLQWNTAGLNGERYIRVKAVDKAGNARYFPAQAESNPTDGIEVHIDNLAPKTAGIIPAHNSFVKEPTSSKVILTGVADLNQAGGTEDVSGVDLESSVLKVDGEAVSSIEHDSIARTLIYEPAGGFSQGQHVVEADIYDRAGNHIIKGPYTFTVDNAAPTADLVLPAMSFTKGTKINLSGKALDSNLKNYMLSYRSSPSGIWYLISGSTPIGNNSDNGTLATWPVPATLGNQYELKLRVEDKAGNFSEDSISGISVVSSGGYVPGSALQIKALPNTGVRGSVAVLGSASLSSNFAFYKLFSRRSPAGSLSLVKQSSIPVMDGTLGSWSTAGTGSYDLVLERYANPPAPVLQDSTTLSNVVVDNIAPAATSIVPTMAHAGVIPGYVNTDEPILRATYKELDSGMQTAAFEARIDGLPIELDFTGEGNARFSSSSQALEITLEPLSQGPHVLKIKGKDKAGNPAAEKIYNFVVDSNLIAIPTPASADISAPTGEYVKGILPIVGTAFDPNIRDYKIFHRRSDTTAYTLIASKTLSAIDALLANWSTGANAWTKNGQFDLLLQLTDKSGLVKTDAVSVVTDNTLPVAEFTQMNGVTASLVTKVTAGVSVTVAGKAYDRGGKDDIVFPNDSFLQYALDFGPGTSPLSWIAVGSSSVQAGGESTQGDLGIWNTTALTPGVYTLRLKTTDRAGNLRTLLKAITVKAP